MSRISSLLLSCIILFFASAPALAKTDWLTGYDFTQRAADREKGRWSLSDWLAIKDRSRMMDMWLSTNAPSPFEFMLGGSYLSYKTDLHDGSDPTSHTSFAGEVSAYAQLVGLTGEYEHNSAENFTNTTGLFNLRVFGNSIQNSSLVLSYGLRTHEFATTTGTSDRMVQQLAQVDLQLYITKYFGFDGKYRYFLPTTDDNLGDVKGDYSEAGLFIDFKALRIFGAWYKENQKNTPASSTTESVTDRTGIRSGIKIFF